MATLALLQESMTAVTSDCASKLSGKPEVSITTVLRPGTVDRPFARLRRASRTLRTPKSDSRLVREGAAGGAASEATVADGSPLGETADPFIPWTTCFKRVASAGKFWEMGT